MEFGAENLRAFRGRQGTAGAVDLDGWSGTDRDEDLRLHTRPVFHRSDLRCAELRRRAAQAGAVFAILASLGTSIALLFRRRDLFLQRSGVLRRREFPCPQRWKYD